MLLAQLGRLLPWNSQTGWEESLRAALGDADRVLDVHRSGTTTHWLLRRNGYRIETDAGNDPYFLATATGSVEAVFVCHLASCLARPHHALSEWIRVLRPGGRLALMEPVAARRRRHAGPFSGRLAPREACQFLELAGLRRVAVHQPGGPFYLASGQKA